MLTANDFAELYAAQGPRLLRAARLMLLCDYHRPDAAGEAQDLTQDVWMRLWERWQALDELPTPGYLFTALKHAAIDAYRHRQVIAWRSLDQPVRSEDGGTGSGEPGAWLLDPCDRYAQLDTRLDLAAALDLLTLGERRALFVHAGGHRASDPRAWWRARTRLAQSRALAGYSHAPIAPLAS